MAGLSNLNALSAAMHAEQDVAVRALKGQLEEKQLALERARMSAEDARAAMASPYNTNGVPPHGRTLSWREFGIERNDRCDHVTFNVIEPAQELLQDARHEILMALSAPSLDSKAALSAAHTAMLAGERRLEDDSNASESESES